ncbi:Alpha/Beta hydrolase protein [Macrophomina phaseolina]|uniref:Alpha/Beta hydrolase protein n=1 Tax=Macrophomina phaseolina TaxID=35725 RepID=A0ABQ8FS79_9PEZI|nr:Alpha/Beta hydrolase protein [Macrophomina phaseolina]
MVKGLNFHFPETDSPRRFKITVDDDFLGLTLRKVRDYRPSSSFFRNWTVEGPPDGALKELADYWANKYNWREVEKTINEEFDHYATTVPGNGNYLAPIPLHFVHERSTNEGAVPLLLLHGWSSTHLEWSSVIKKLSRNGEKSYHVVAVDLPGFGFSPAPTQPGLGPKEMGVGFDALMQQLGYRKYGVVSTDLGWLVAMSMVEHVSENIIGHFTDFFFAMPTPSDFARQANNETTQEENEYLESLNEFTRKHFAYATVQNQKPGLLAAILADSPVGMAAWLWDLKQGGSDGYAFTYEQIITDAMVTWIQNPYGSIRAYSLINELGLPSEKKSDVVTGVTAWGNLNGPFPGLAKFPLVPRSWVERVANVTYFKRYEIGGHWPAFNQPDQWAADVGEFFSL